MSGRKHWDQNYSKETIAHLILPADFGQGRALLLLSKIMDGDGPGAGEVIEAYRRAGEVKEQNEWDTTTA